MNDRLKVLILGDPETIAGTVYGTIIVMSIIAVGAHAYEHHLWPLVVLAGGSTVVLWLAHVYSHVLGESLSLGRRTTVEEVASIARREFAVIAAAIISLAAVALGATDLLAHRTAVQLALWLGVAVLAAQGIRYARLERLSPDLDDRHDWSQPRHRVSARGAGGADRAQADSAWVARFSCTMCPRSGADQARLSYAFDCR